ncbi:MAG: 16S rRNA (cytosine(1402)-N(4))-methyltransferase RsmH [Candidatus Neomarinimicrobiota bacterium]|nr:16S rRNA (cytosine(1402)-N(4))-methyltransferase RsmH [Candidatus Neomarinimicrobiota bacterium]
MNQHLAQDSGLTHIPVMITEVLSYLAIKPDGIYLDGTIGPGGHATPILKKLIDGGKVVGIDRDEEALDICKQNLKTSSSILSLYHNSYNNLDKILAAEGLSAFSGVLLDLGLSSLQLGSKNRGFSYRSGGPLDMRYDQSSGSGAGKLINQTDQDSLAQIFKEYGEERLASRIAKSIKEMTIMNTIADLREAIRRCTPPNHRDRTFARIFQALRIAVNQELGILEQFLTKFIDFLRPGGRIVIISYHSLEDRLVKHSFKKLASGGTLDILTKRPITATEKERKKNRRARSAKLRAAVKVT